MLIIVAIKNIINFINGIQFVMNIIKRDHRRTFSSGISHLSFYVYTTMKVKATNNGNILI